MNANEIFDKVKDLITSGNLDEAKQFIEDNKDDLGEYWDKAQTLLEGNEAVGDILNKVKGFFGK